MKRIISLALCAVLVLGLFSGAAAPQAKAAEGWKYGLNGAMGWNEDTYYTISKRTTNNNWRQALASANGEIAFLESGDPSEDVFIFNNTKIVYDDNGVHEAPVLSNIIDQQRAGAINYNSWVWNQAANSYDQQTYGISGGRGMVWSRPYMPAAQYRIKNNDYTGANRNNYNRWTNYETAEVGAQWKDASGNEWNRRSFASRADDVIVTYIEAPEGRTLDLTISMDHITDMRNEGTLDTLPATDYVVTQEAGDVVGFGTVGKFVTRNITGTKDNGKTLFSYGGWASSTRIVLGGGGSVAYNAAKRTVPADRGFSVSQAFDANDPQLRVTGTDRILLITKVDRQDDGCNTVDDVRRVLYDRLQGEIADLINMRHIGCDEESYQALLAPHAAIHGGMFNNVRIELCQTDEEKADRALTNQRLIEKQNSDKNHINKAFLERVYNNGRYGLICAHGYGSTRLSAIWCGTWNPSWSGDYTLDANTNLQVSGLNTGNMAEAGQGYINFIVRMVADWEINAERIYGMTDAILGPPRVDGTGQGQSYHYSDTYPHVFVNGITDWLLLPIFEYWQCYGNRKIELGKDIDPARNASVLDWSEEDIARIRADGYYDLEEDVLFPMAMKAMNFWIQFADERYYTDGRGVRHVNDGTTLSSAIAAGDENARYIFAPGFSPENSPERGGASVQALAYNVSMDIAAAHDALFIARTMLERVNPDDPRLAQWAEFEKRIPEYLYEPNTGELKEWASYALKEAHNHRHESHAYAAWPGYEAQDDKAIREGIAIAMDRRSAAYNGQEATESHGATHKALVEARLKRPVALERVMLYLLTNGYQYSNMLTSHNRSNGSCLCTDSAFGLMGAVNESLLYSNTGIVEILPTLLPGFDKGSITGLRVRNNAQADIVWDKSKNAASLTLTGDGDAALKVQCGLDWTAAKIDGRDAEIERDDQGRKYVNVALEQGRTVDVTFTLASAEPIARRDAYGTIAAGSYDEQSGGSTPAPDLSVEPDALDYLVFKGLDFGVEGSKSKMNLTVRNDRTEGGLHRDGTATVRIFTHNPNDGSAPFAETVIPNTGGAYQTFSVNLPERLSGVQDVYIKFQDGGVRLKSLEFFPMPAANVTDGERVSISAQKPLTLELNTDVFSFTLNGSAVQSGRSITEPGEYTLVIRQDGALYKTVRFTAYISEANRLLEKTVNVQPGQSVALTGAPADAGARVWLAPPDVHSLWEGRYMTSASGSTISAPAAEGSYCLIVADAAGNILSRSDALVRVGESGLMDVDFTDAAGADAYEILGRTNAQQTASGLVLRTTRNAVEPCNGQNSDAQANTPEDMVRLSVNGDWTATLQFDFDPTASNGYYQFFGFFAAEGGDFQNMAGIRGGDGALQNFLRVGGSITADSSDLNSTPGLASAGTYWFRIEKSGDSYLCSRSENGSSFTEMFRYERTGIEADSLLIDAYTGMTEGYTFTLKSLHFEGLVGAHVHSYDALTIPAACTEEGYTTYTCTECGDMYFADRTSALGHDFGPWQTDQAAVCTMAGSEKRTCGRCGETETRATAPLGHDWGEPAYTWSEDGRTVAAERVCRRDAAHTERETAEASSRITKPATAQEAGEAVYTATFTNPAFAAQTRTVVLPRLDDGPKLPCDGGDGCPGKAFKDMPPKGNWAHDAIDWAVVRKITTGTSDTSFSPAQGCTRAQVVTFLWRAAGEPEPKDAALPFRDVSSSKYYAKAVAWAVEKGITKGTSDDAFSPDATCTRGQIVTFLWRNAGAPVPGQAAAAFRDVPADAYFAEAVAWAAEQNVTTGTAPDAFSPGSTCTRAQVVTFLYRSLVK